MYFDFVTTTNSKFICNQRTDIVLRVLYKVFSGTVKVNDECLQNSFTNHATQQISHLQLLFSISRFISFYDVITKLEKMHAILFVTFCKNCSLSLFFKNRFVTSDEALFINVITRKNVFLQSFEENVRIKKVI